MKKPEDVLKKRLSFKNLRKKDLNQQKRNKN
jgi:hypothetical protein